MSDISTDSLKNTIDEIELTRAHVFKYFVLKVTLCALITLSAMAFMFFLLMLNGATYLGLTQSSSLIALVSCALLLFLMQFLTHKIYQKAQRFRQGEARQKILAAVLAGSGLTISHDEQAQNALIGQAKTLLPNASIVEYSDYVSAQNMQMTSFRLIDRQVETVQRGNSSHTRTDYYLLFQGFVMSIDIKPVEQDLLILKDMGLMNGVRGVFSKMQRISLEDPVFEKAFEAYGTDQLESRKILSPKVMEHIVELLTFAQNFKDLKAPYWQAEKYDGHHVLKNRLQNRALQMHFQKGQLIIACGLDQPLWQMPPIYRKWGADKWVNYIQAQSLAFQTLYQKARALR
jgi:hypothetical protein